MVKNEDKKINAKGYGFVIVSPDIFEQCRKDRNIKDKKMISYFSKDNNSFYEFIAQGAFIPVHHLNYDRYSLFFSIGHYDKELVKDWNIKVVWKDFNLTVNNSNSLWAMEIDEVEKWSVNKLKKDIEHIEGKYYDINDNEFTEYKAIKYSIPENKYNVNIYGLEKKNKNKNKDTENYGFLFELIEVENFISKTDSSEINFRELFE